MVFESVREVKRWLSERVKSLNSSNVDEALTAYNDLVLRKMETNEVGEFHLEAKLNYKTFFDDYGYLNGTVEGQFLIPIAKGESTTYYVYGDGTFFYEKGRLTKANVKNLSILSADGPLSIESLTAVLKGASIVKVFEVESANELAPYYGSALMAQTGIEPDSTLKVVKKESNLKTAKKQKL